MSLAATICHARVAGPQDQPDRHARRRRLPGRHDRGAARRRGRALRRQRRDGRRGADRAHLDSAPRSCDLSRVVFVNMLDRERADFFRVLGALQEQLSEHCVAIHLPIGAEHELTGDRRPPAHVRVHGARTAAREGGPQPIPDRAGRRRSQEYREKLLDAVVETDEELMERYLDGRGARRRGRRARAEGRRHARRAVPGRVRRRDEEPRHDRAPRPARRGRPVAGEEGRRRSRSATRSTAAFVFKTIADPFAGRINVFRVLAGTVTGDTTLVNARDAREGAHRAAARCCRARSTSPSNELGAGDIGAVAKLKDVADRRRARSTRSAPSSRRTSTSPSR